MSVKRKDLIIVEPLDKVAVIVKYLISCKKVRNNAGVWIRDDKTYSYCQQGNLMTKLGSGRKAAAFLLYPSVLPR